MYIAKYTSVAAEDRVKYPFGSGERRWVAAEHRAYPFGSGERRWVAAEHPTYPFGSGEQRDFPLAVDDGSGEHRDFDHAYPLDPLPVGKHFAHIERIFSL